MGIGHNLFDVSPLAYSGDTSSSAKMPYDMSWSESSGEAQFYHEAFPGSVKCKRSLPTYLTPFTGEDPDRPRLGSIKP